MILCGLISESDISDPCGGNDPMILITSNEGILTPPGYPLSTQENLDCRWRIIVEDGSAVQISFLDFDLEEGYII